MRVIAEYRVEHKNGKTSRRVGPVYIPEGVDFGLEPIFSKSKNTYDKTKCILNHPQVGSIIVLENIDELHARLSTSQFYIKGYKRYE